MKNIFKSLSTVIVLVLLTVAISCTTKKKVIDDDFATDSAEAGFSNADLEVEGTPDASVAIDEGAPAAKDEFSEFDTPAAAATPAPEDATASLESELNSVSETPPAPVVTETPPPVEIVETVSPPPPTITETPITETPVAETPVAESHTISKITNIQYKGNSNGGTVIISSDNPLNYTTRVNAAANQVVVEVNNTVVANHLKRPLNTKDMSSSIGHVDVYQKKDSKTARFVIQLRPNSPEPLVQPEGNSLLIVGSAVDGSGPNPSQSTQVAEQASPPAADEESAVQGIMASDDLEAFLSYNNKFYGKKISIETTDMDVRDILKLIAEESGINMIFDDDVGGKSTLKLRKVPWDQALVTLLKSKRFGYRRQGSILRIARIDTLIKEDNDAVELKKSKVAVEPLIVRNFAINYAEIDKLESKIKDFITDSKKDAVNRGRVTSDTRTNTLIVTETEAKLTQISELIKALDTQPQQVMIEARIIEASDSFYRSIGGSIGLNRSPTTGASITNPNNVPGFNQGRIVTGTGVSNPSYSSPSLSINPQKSQSGSFVGNIFFGTLGAFGNLDAQLALDEIENRIKILSSPRVAVLTNTTANINQGATILQRTSSTTASTTGASTETFTPVKIGVTLKVTPQISNIGTVRLVLDVSRTAPTPGGQGGETTDRSVKTEVVVKSGDTAVVGGVFQSDVNKGQRGVPGLKDIPLLGTLFKGEDESNSKTELMVFITPKVIPLVNQIFKAESEEANPVQ